MKIDRFADSIRRKLDSIRPEFSERDWARMQATLKQAGPNPNTPTPATHPFAGHVTRYAIAGAIGTAIFLTTSIWQHYELNRLHQTLEQVTQKVNRSTVADSVVATTGKANTEPYVARSESAESKRDGRGRPRPDDSDPTENKMPVGIETKRDTVYIDRYVTVPAPSMRLRTTDNSQPASQSERTSAGMGNRAAQSDLSTSSRRSGKSMQNRISNPIEQGVSDPASPSLPVTQQRNALTNTEKLASNVASTPRRVKNQDRVFDTRTSRDPSGQTMDRRASSAQPAEQSTNRNVPGIGSARQTTNTGLSAGNATNSNTPDNRVTQTHTTSSDVPPVANSGAKSTVGYEPLVSLPMQPSTIRWDELMALRAKRLMRPARTTVVSGQTSTASATPSTRRVQPTPLRFRVGVGADVSTQMASIGIYSELMVLKHWSLGIGLSQATFATNFFPNPPAFNKNNPQDFRRQYTRGLDPRLEIFDIKMYTTRIQLPVSLGYRIPLSSSLTLLPTVGTNLNLQSQQHISFNQELPYRLGKQPVAKKSLQVIDLFNNMTFGASIDWQRKHWVAQVGPLVTAPLQSDPGCQQNVTVGLRARVLYQF